MTIVAPARVFPSWLIFFFLIDALDLEQSGGICLRAHSGGARSRGEEPLFLSVTQSPFPMRGKSALREINKLL